MHQAIVYLPGDRRRALLTGQPLPARAIGTVLFVDISGFTPLTETLARQFGRSRGAELLTRTLNEVYQTLIGQVDRHGGSVIGFAGDAITCWFDAVDDGAGAAAQRAAASALTMQHAIAPFARHTVAPGAVAELAIKTALASGPVRRLLVGDPTIQVIEVLAGAPLERMAAAEHVAQRGELVADLETIHLLGELATVGVWRRGENGDLVAVFSYSEAASHRASLVSPLLTKQPLDGTVSHPSPVQPNLRQSLVSPDLIRPWLLPAVWANLQNDEEHYLAELRPATALFVRFIGLDFEHDEQAGDRLDAYIRWVQQVLARYAGTLIQLTTGDKGSYFYAAFGAPVAHDDDTAHAIAAALELRTSPSRFAFLTQVQLGVSAGMMRVGAYGSSTRRTYGVLGDATNLAARLMMDANPGQILVSGRVAELIQPHFRVEALGERHFKGKSQKQLVFGVIGQNLPTLIQFDALYHTPPLGRDVELATLADAINQAVRGAGYLIRLEGEAGVGKSHLAAATARLAADQGFSVLYGACQSAGQQSYAALRTPLAALLGLDERSPASHADQVAHLQATLAAIEPAWLVRLPLLGDLLGLPIADNPTTAAFDPRLRREALGSLVVSLLHHYARQQPIFLLLEDVHWLDEADQVIVLTLCRALADWPLVTCLLHHPMNPHEIPFAAELDVLPRQLCLHLGELTAPATAALVTQRLQGVAEPLITDLIHTQTQGNPLFVEELTDALCARSAIIQENKVWRAARSLLQALHEANALARVGDHWRLRGDARLDAVTLGLPDTVHGLVLARLDLLTEEARLTLKVASVIGRVFETRVLAAAHPRAPGVTALQQQIAELEERDFARIEAPPPHPAYIFKHNITQEAIYHTLLESQRQELHLAIAHVLERTTPAAVERLAHHYSQADTTQATTRARALFYLDAAAWRAKRSYANETTLAYLDRALALETRWEWLRNKCEVLHILGQRLQEEATLLVLEADPRADQAVVAELWADFHEATSQFPAARANLQQALDVYAAQVDHGAQVRVLARLGEIVLREGDIDAAEQLYRQALTLLAGASSDDGASLPEVQPSDALRPSPLDPSTIRAQVLLGLGVVMRQRGEYDAAAAMLTEALDLYAAQENQPEVATALTRLGGVAFLRRDFTAARDIWQQALTIRRAIGDREDEGSSLLNIAQVYTSLGDYGAALPLLRQALAIQQAVGNRWWENAVWNALGIVALAVGDYAEARRCITQAEALCLAVGDEAGAAIMTFNLAQVARECGEHTAALAWLARSRQWAQENDDPEFEAQCLTELALTAQTAGRLEDAEQHANDALRLYTALEMQAAQSTDLATLALVQLARGDRCQARATAQKLLEIINASETHQIEYPQRDLYVAALVAGACAEPDAAATLLHRACELVQARAARISDAALRRSYLENVRVNREVIAAASTPLSVGGSSNGCDDSAQTRRRA